MSEEVKKLSKEVSELMKQERIKKRWDVINKNQHAIYEKLTSSTEKIEAEHAQLIKSLLADYEGLFRAKLRLVDSLMNDQKDEIKAYRVERKILKEVIKKINEACKFYESEYKECIELNRVYNKKIWELNDVIKETNQELRRLREL